MTDPLHPRPAIWNIVRWIAVLPVVFAVFTVLMIALIEVVGRVPLSLSTSGGYIAIYAVSTLIAIAAGALTAPRFRFQTACVLAVLLGGVVISFMVVALVAQEQDTSVLPIVLGELAAGLFAVFLFWRGGKGKE